MERLQHHHFVFDFLLGVIVSNEGQVLRAASGGEKVDQYISIFFLSMPFLGIGIQPQPKMIFPLGLNS